MIARRLALHVHVPLAAFALALCLLWLAPLRAQPQDSGAAPTGPEIENSKYQFAGVVNSNSVYVRSGPSENDYPTVKLDKGAEVTVVGIRFDWLKVVPPEGSFCYVAKAFVDRHGNGSTGKVTSTLNVRVGSQLNELKAKIASKLEPGATVEIVGEEQEYFKIRPPEGVFYYVNKQFVDPVRAVNAEPAGPAVGGVPAPSEPQAKPEPMAGNEPPEATPEPTISQTPTENTAQAQPTTPEEPTVTDNTASEPTTGPSYTDASRRNDGAPDAAPAPVPAPARSGDAEAEFERLENAYGELSQKPLADQPVTEMLEGYQRLAAGDSRLPESLRRIAEFKVEMLKHRLAAQQEFLATQKQIQDMRTKQQALDTEREEIEQRIKESDIHFYTAVGTLRTSSVQRGPETLYRLTDPSTHRTLVYMRTNDPKVAVLMGQFIGVRGEVQQDAQLNARVITPTDFEAVNPAKVGQSIASQIIPPSLLPNNARTE
jgi:SH3-like domain-containing protein